MNKEKQKNMLPFLILTALYFCFLPLLSKDSNSSVIVYTWILPITCLITSIIYGINNSFNAFYVISVTIIAALLLLIRIPRSWELAFFYGIATLIGNLIGMILYKRGVRIKNLGKYGRYFSIITVALVVTSYIVAIIISTSIMNQMTQITYKAIGYGVTLREDIIDFKENIAQINFYDYSGGLRESKNISIEAKDLARIKRISSLSLFPLWQSSYYDQGIASGDQYVFIMESEENERNVFGSNAYPLTYQLVVRSIKSAING